MGERIGWIDYAKTITIYLVILAHTPLWKPAQSFIYVFHMPLFFFLSGYLFSFERHIGFWNFVKKRFRQLMMPYFIFSIITFLFWVLIGRKFGDDSSLNIPIYQPLIGILYGNGIQPWMIHCIPLWFFPCLFLVEIMFYFLFQKTQVKNFYLMFIFTLAYFFIQFNTIRFPWSLNTSIVALGIYGVGNISKKWTEKSFAQKSFIKIIGIAALSVSVYFISCINGRTNMHIHYYGNYFLFLLGSMTGILNIILISQLLERAFKRPYWIEYISKNTFIVVGFHLIVGSFIKAITVFVLNIPLSVYQEKFWINILFSLLTLAFLIPVIFIMNTLFPFIQRGKSRSKLHLSG